MKDVNCGTPAETETVDSGVLTNGCDDEMMR